MKVQAAILGCVALLLALFAFPREVITPIRAGRSRAVEEGRERLAASRFDARERAFRRLVSLGEASRPALEEALSSKDAEVRARASAALRALDRARETPEERRLREYDYILRAGLRVAGGLDPGSPRDEALRLSPDLAARAAVGIARELEPEVLEHQRAVVFLRRLGRPESADYLADALARGWWIPSTTYHLAEGLRIVGGPEQAPAVREAVSSTDPQTRRYAVRVLATIGGLCDAAILRRAAGDPEPIVRAEAARALPSLAGREAAPDLRRLARDEDASVRAAAVGSLGKIPGAPFRPTAFRALSDLSPAVRAAGLDLLRRRGGATDGRAARALLHDPSPLVRGAAIRALAELGLAEDAVVAGVADESHAVRREAVLAAGRLPESKRREALEQLPEESGSFLLDLRERVLSARGTN